MLIKCIKAFQQKVRSIQEKIVGRKERRDFFMEYYPLQIAEYAMGF